MRPGAELRQPGKDRAVEDLDRKQRDQADHRAQPQRDPLAVGQVQDIVIKLVRLVPQPDAATADVGHGLGNIKKVLEKLGGDVLVDAILERQLERDAHQI